MKYTAAIDDSIRAELLRLEPSALAEIGYSVGRSAIATEDEFIATLLAGNALLGETNSRLRSEARQSASEIWVLRAAVLIAVAACVALMWGMGK